MRLTNKNQPTFSGKSWCYGGKTKLMLAENKIEEVMDNSIGKSVGAETYHHSKSANKGAINGKNKGIY